MAYNIHMKTERDGITFRNLFNASNANAPVTLEPGQYASGFWDIPEEEARQAIGGMLYLHETKAKPAVFGGVITDVKIIDDYEAARSKRAVFVVEPVSVHTGKKIDWPKNGHNHTMAYYSGLVAAE